MWWPWRRDEARAGGLLDSGALGRQGEKIAQRFLRRGGWKILADNYRCPEGEADLIALDPSTRKTSGRETIVFVEVKTRAADGFAAPESAVDEAKRRHLRKIADYYLKSRDAAAYDLRFDVVSIVLAPGQEPKIKHIVNAF